MGTITNIRNLQQCGKELEGVKTYNEAVQIMERNGLRLAEYGDYNKEGTLSYVYYNPDGDRYSDIGIRLIYSWKKDETREKHLLADQVVQFDIFQ